MAERALALDLLTRIRNVQWAVGGLAVEFGDKAEDAPKPAAPATAGQRSEAAKR